MGYGLYISNKAGKSTQLQKQKGGPCFMEEEEGFLNEGGFCDGQESIKTR